ncbi:MAG: hypothetical protein Barrevirus6_13 [Barrevirus sp.]|uniref:Uncharacterized protein n=1 Tax=Barrevirus sp. TaxID=2487763 RepID=A0A3G4ZQ10_9VIRU|nr:MAG: hypothetical protein Barrevirus6_13 [Barrevirus sp.]
MGLINSILDYTSEKMLEKPTAHLLTDHMKIQVHHNNLYEDLINLVYDVANIFISPIKMINDRKFAVLSFDPSYSFVSQNLDPSQNQSDISKKPVNLCDKVIIYISGHLDKVTEEKKDRRMHNITIDNTDYSVPINSWYTFDTGIDKKLYFYIHLSIVNGSKTIVFAIHKEKEDQLNIMKDKVIDYYMKTLGKPKMANPQSISDIL